MISVFHSEATVAPESAIEKAFSCPSVVSFASFFDIPKVQELAGTNPRLFETLKVFAYGTIEDLPQGVDLPSACRIKLLQLSLISYASQNRELPYSDLMQKFGMDSKRDLEDLVIDAIYNNLIKARLDSVRGVVLVDDWMARDVANSDAIVPEMTTALANWLEHAETTQKAALARADAEDEAMKAAAAKKKKIEQQINDARTALEETANRSDIFSRNDFNVFPTSSENNGGTPRSKRRHQLGGNRRPFMDK